MNRMFSPFQTFAVVSTREDSQPRNVTELFDKIDASFMELNASELITTLVMLMATAQVHQTHHWSSRGFTGHMQHKLFQDVYVSAYDHIDELGEKVVSVAGTDAVSANQLMRLVSLAVEWLVAIYDPAGYDTERSNVQLSLSIEEAFLGSINYAAMLMEANGTLSRGIDNLLAEMADSSEHRIYLLRQSLIG